jgi:hypothetical protein
MAPRANHHKAPAGALRAAMQIEPDPTLRESIAELIDRETGLREILDVLEGIIAEAGDLIESRSPELVAHARTVIRNYGDESARQAE